MALRVRLALRPGSPRGSWRAPNALIMARVGGRGSVQHWSKHAHRQSSSQSPTRTPQLFAYVGGKSRSTTRQKFVRFCRYAALAAPVVFYIWAPRDPVIFTGRERILMSTPTEEDEQGRNAYSTLGFMKGVVPEDDVMYTMVHEIVERCAFAATTIGANMTWKYCILNDSAVNASCLPGGYIIINKGLIEWVWNECERYKNVQINERRQEAGDENLHVPEEDLDTLDPHSLLAFVICHEISHCIARHAGERMSIFTSRLMSTFLHQTGLSWLFQYLYFLPMSRKLEKEADHIGIFLLARTGYDITNIPYFLERLGGTNHWADWLATHPSGKSRKELAQVQMVTANFDYEVFQSLARDKTAVYKGAAKFLHPKEVLRNSDKDEDSHMEHRPWGKTPQPEAGGAPALTSQDQPESNTHNDTQTR
eukprot:gb/GECG01008936.1/.p1 GENE.gb/GECG01008936.1/~~gb/GECG01008936.1/.p1  ORF type:complete len:422 (+),score=25.30 gb/GECG01008936.1/:1-1266(+)